MYRIAYFAEGRKVWVWFSEKTYRTQDRAMSAQFALNTGGAVVYKAFPAAASNVQEA